MKVVIRVEVVLDVAVDDMGQGYEAVVEEAILRVRDLIGPEWETEVVSVRCFLEEEVADGLLQ